MQKIMIIEDEAALAQELALLLTRAGYQAYIVQDFAHPLLEIESQLPDLLLLDIQLPGVNGHQLLQEIRKKYQFPIIMVTSRANEMDEVLAMSYGADNYITKPYNPTALLLYIAAMFKRMQPQSTNLIQYHGVQIDLNKWTITKEDQITHLTKNEQLIFQMLWQHRGKIVTREMLMTELWNNDEFINDNALSVNISRLRQKFADLDLADVIETKKKQGYLLME
ncbi:response regulator transcription factor [Enterococcus cecorum]|uniref:Response regulator transcription factor n=3 Tax=Enterococcus cecorum TaxID=44008 RepID=A0AAW9JHU7_9ENTE|nr:response regulator transcription factor [Enterococcus cecorum]MDZ5504554.1 response regulator transcription factor [Enterococcus cecorum]MDZ5531987.1 response regulator transcription factor [Enterococcus cecorum]MDZ5544898.1 response regulator transcription factor [Enterococcus cecorum]MDZ5549318.1 response regulator transcription factor [Enterococcus cecorum]MDZ5551647.1 response regulator transcription factor [Enterococcus cecorum]